VPRYEHWRRYPETSREQVVREQAASAARNAGSVVARGRVDYDWRCSRRSEGNIVGGLRE